MCPTIASFQSPLHKGIFLAARHSIYPDNEAVKRPEISPRIEYLIEASNFPCPEMLGTFILAFSRALPEEGSFRDSLVQ